MVFFHKLCKKRCFKISNYKILRLGEYLKLRMTEKFNKISVDM